MLTIYRGTPELRYPHSLAHTYTPVSVSDTVLNSYPPVYGVRLWEGRQLYKAQQWLFCSVILGKVPVTTCGGCLKDRICFTCSLCSWASQDHSLQSPDVLLNPKWRTVELHVKLLARCSDLRWEMEKRNETENSGEKKMPSGTYGTHQKKRPNKK